MKTIKNALLLASAMFLGVSCDAIEPGGGRTPSPDEILEAGDNDVQNLERTGSGDGTSGYQGGGDNKFFRTGTQYIFAVSKTLEILGSALKTASDYESIKTKFYEDSTASEENLRRWSSAVTAYSLVASAGCTLFLQKEEVGNMSIDEMKDYVADRAFVDADAAQAAKDNATALSDGMEEGPARQAACMTIVAQGNILF